jgi:hypothetical protein
MSNKQLRIFLAFLLLLFLQSGCKQATEPKASDIYVNFEIESDFNDDSVKVALDDKILLESRVTTDYTISLAWSSGFQKLSRIAHNLFFTVVEYDAQSHFLIDATNDTSTVLMRFDKSTKKISIQQLKGVVLRD